VKLNRLSFAEVLDVASAEDMGEGSHGESTSGC
jgi:hypothetical protein